MNVDAVVLGMIAIADLFLIAHLRQRRRNAMRQERVIRSLALAIRRENGEIVIPKKWPWAKAI